MFTRVMETYIEWYGFYLFIREIQYVIGISVYDDTWNRYGLSGFD